MGFNIKAITTSKFTLPIVCVITCILWWFGNSESVGPQDMAHGGTDFPVCDYGVWSFLAVLPEGSPVALVVGLAFAILAVYLMAELNNANVLLRISSRMLSSLLSLLLTAAVFIHAAQPAHIVMLLSLLSYFTLFQTYQNGDARVTFLTYIYISLASLVFPKLLWTVPFYWIAQVYLRSLTLRSFCASVVGILLPYWLYGGYALCADHASMFVEHVSGVVSFGWGDYAALSLQRMGMACFLLLLFVVGTVDFYLKSYLDKTRTRIIYNVVVMFGVAGFFFLALQVDYFDTLFPLALLPTVIVAGHHLVLSDTKFTRIYTVVILLLLFALIVLGLR